MPRCSYCGATFTAKQNLNRHQRTVKSCLAIQKEQGVVTAEEQFSCQCGETFNRRDEFNRHKVKCSIATPASTTHIENATINNTQNNNTLNFNINVFGSTMSSLTPELIAERVLEALSLDAVEKGVAHMTAEVARPVFTNEKANWLVRVADGSRNKLMVRTDEGDISDHQGHNTTRLLRQPFIRASLLALKETDKPKDVENTIEEIEDDDVYDKQAMGALLKAAPSRFDQTNPLIFTEAHRLAEEKAFAELHRVMAKRKRNKVKQLEKEAVKWREELLDHAQDLHDGTFWHPTQHLVIQPETGERPFSVLGKREKRTDTTQSLVRADIEHLVAMGLTSYLAPEYAMRVAELAVK